jgi:hypothetical protein
MSSLSQLKFCKGARLMLDKLQQIRSRIIAAAFNIGTIAQEINPIPSTSGSPSKADRLLAIQQELGEASRGLNLYAALDWRDARDELPSDGEEVLVCDGKGIIDWVEFCFDTDGNHQWSPSGNPFVQGVRFWAAVVPPKQLQLHLEPIAMNRTNAKAEFEKIDITAFGGNSRLKILGDEFTDRPCTIEFAKLWNGRVKAFVNYESASGTTYGGFNVYVGNSFDDAWLAVAAWIKRSDSWGFQGPSIVVGE